MKLALVSPLPPVKSPAARLVADLLEPLLERLLDQLPADGEVHLLPHAPEQIDAALASAEQGEKRCSVHPAADLPHLLATGAVDLPVYFVADAVEHAWQIRYVREHPGLLVLLSPGIHDTIAAVTEESGDVDAYRELLVEAHGEAARDWPERFLWHADRERVRRRLPLTRLLCGRSRGVLVPAELRSRIERRNPGVPIADIPTSDTAAAASTLLTMADELLASPRELAPFPQPDWPSAEVVIVGYNSRKIIGPALQSIVDQDYPSLRCTVIDNASVDGTADYVRNEFPSVDVVVSPDNLGFAGGNNLAFARTTAKYVVLFNQDAVARRDFVRELVRVAERDENIASVGGKMLMLRCPTIINSTGIVVDEGGFAVDRQIGEKDEDPSPVPVRVFGACGGACLLRVSALRKVGGFDESFFMYFEDVDLSWRLRLAGLDILYAPLARVQHDWFGDLDEDRGADREKTLRRRFLCERNRLQCVLKNHEFGTLRRLWRTLRRYDKGRLGGVAAAIRAGGDVSYLRKVAGAIRGAWRWNLLRLPRLLAKRRAVQRLRRVTDRELAEFIEPKCAEPSVGDLEIIQDRHSAQSSPRVQMGVNDRRSLGPGWHPPEPMEGGGFLRWCRGRAWLYLTADSPAQRLHIRLAGVPEPNELHVTADARDLGVHGIEDHDMHVVTFDTGAPIPPGTTVEVKITCRSFRPSDRGLADPRELGLRVLGGWLESTDRA